jgi:hypothetical protein
MEILKIKEYWQDNQIKIRACQPDYIDRTLVKSTTFDFLTACGLPSDAGPFLSFGELHIGKLMTPNEYFQIEYNNLNRYLVFGINGSGDTICIDTYKDDEIVYLNHDNGFERIFMNKSILQFASCLIKYHEFGTSLIDNKSGEFDIRKFTDEEFEHLRQVFLEIDGYCLTDNSFWETELFNLKWIRDEESS